MLVITLFEGRAKNLPIVFWHFILMLFLPKLGCYYDLSFKDNCNGMQLINSLIRVTSCSIITDMMWVFSWDSRSIDEMLNAKAYKNSHLC